MGPQVLCQAIAELGAQSIELLSFRWMIEGDRTCFHGVIGFLIATYISDAFARDLGEAVPTHSSPWSSFLVLHPAIL